MTMGTFRRWIAAGLLAGFASPLAAGPAEEKAYETVYGAKAKAVLASRSPKARADFAAELLAAARKTPGWPAFQAVLCEKAYVFGLKGAAGYATAVEAARLLATVAPAQKAQAEEKLGKALELRHRTARGADQPAAAADLVEHQVALADARRADGELDAAAGLYRRALRVATRAALAAKPAIAAKLADVTNRQAVARQIAALDRAVKANPKNSLAARRLLMLHLVEMDDPNRAVALLDRAQADERLRRCVPLAAKALADLPEAACLELGDWYRDLSGKAKASAKPAMLARAEGLYVRFLRLHARQDTQRLQADAAVKAVRADRGWLPAAGLKTIVIEALVDGDSQLWVTPRGLLWKSGGVSKPGLPGRENEPTWVNGLRWMPVWNHPSAGRGRDETELLEFAIGPVDDLKLEVVAVAPERHVRRIDRRSPVTTERKGEALIVRIPDAQGGDRWYTLRLRRP